MWGFWGRTCRRRLRLLRRGGCECAGKREGGMWVNLGRSTFSRGGYEGKVPLTRRVLGMDVHKEGA